MPPRISIVIPNYNSGVVLERAIRSLLSQDYPNLQLIMMDAASNDESRDTIERYRHVFDVVVSEKDKGQADAINKGFARANGDVFGWLCADDELIPGALRRVGEIFESDPTADVITGACERVFADGSRCVIPPNPKSWEIIGIQDPVEQSATFWRSRLHRKVGELTLEFHLAFDWDLWNRFKRAGGKLVTTDQLLSRYYFSETNKSGSAGRTFAKEAFVILRRYGPMGGLLAHLYRFLYRHFDLHGCYDQPPTCTPTRSKCFVLTLRAMRALVGQERLYQYNWHFASCQERGLKWW
jgi:glycosyltransferase involved in cell wall biosynthesis